MATKKKKPAAKSGKAFPRSKSSSGGSSRSAEPKPAPAPAAPEHTEADPERPVFERHNNNQARSIILFAVAILIFLLSIIQGTSGWLALHKGLKSFFGVSLLLLPWLLMYLAVTDDKDPQSTEFGKRLFSVFGVVMLFSVFVEILFGGGRLQDLSFGESVALLSDEGMKWSGGGMIAILAYALQRFLGDVGSKIIIILSMFVSVMLMTRTRLTVFLDKVTAPFRRIAAIFREDAQDGAIIAEYEEEEDSVRDYAQQAAMDTYGEDGMNYPSSPQEPQFLMDIPLDEMPADPMADTIDLPLPEIREEARKAADPAEDAELEELIRNATGGKNKKKTKEEEKLEAVLEIADEVAQQAGTDGRPYQMPRIDFLNPGKSHANDPGAGRELREKADLLQEVLQSFNVEARIINIARGPSVTRYEVQPAAGVKVSRITSLANDIALNFATEGVRIEAPIPGKPAVGIEVPNSNRDTVSLRELLESRQFTESRSKLVFGVGKDIAGNVIIGDIADMPHMIIAGATGSGKSVCTNSIIMSILYHATPDEVKLILIDPKIVEFRVYDGIPHLLIPVVTDPKKAAGALNWAVQEMLKRYDIFAENGVRNLKEYNKRADKEKNLERMPQIVICIDELAELMMTASKEVEDAICRLAQLARAAGMHLIIATQRPTTNIITGLIKANIPSRIALSVKSQIDSRVILDMGGAETLLGNGDMLYLPNGQPKPVRVQGCFVSTSEIEKVVNFIKSQSETDYDESIIHAVDQLTVNTDAEKALDNAEPELDEDAGLIEQAIEVVVAAGQASTSNLQRRLRLGYGRAARIMDELEKMGIIGPYEGAKPRRVLITKAQLDERKLRNMK